MKTFIIFYVSSSLRMPVIMMVPLSLQMSVLGQRDLDQNSKFKYAFLKIMSGDIDRKSAI